MSGKRQKTQYVLALEPMGRVNLLSAATQGRTIRGEVGTRKPGLDRTTNGEGV